MKPKPTYEALERSVRILEAEREQTRNARAESEETKTALLESEMKYARLVNNLRAGIVVIADGTLSFVNLAFAQFMGYSREELIGTNFIAYVAPEYRSLVQERYTRRMAGQAVPPAYEIELLKKDRQPIWVEVDAQRIVLHGKLHNLVIIRDTTERKRLENDLADKGSLLESVIMQSPFPMAVVDAVTGKPI